jgi:D-serine deaminase-like pyridoxal phosphate-dependent protein
VHVDELPTPALVIDADALEHNLATMAAALPGAALRPHVKAHKCTALAAAQAAHGHLGFTCATPREVVGMAAAGLGHDLLLANETLDPARLRAMAAAPARVTVAVDSVETIDAAAAGGIAEVLIDVNVGLPRCGCAVADAGRLADHARARGLAVRGVMGYEGHLMMVADSDTQRTQVDDAMARLRTAHAAVGGDVVSAGGTGTWHLHHAAPGRVTEVQAGSYALLDSQYATAGGPWRQACFVIGTVVSLGRAHAVIDVGLKAMGMDHGNPVLDPDRGPAGAVWFLSDEHLTFAPDRPVRVGERAAAVPAHIDPTMAMHDVAWLVRAGEVIDRWPIDLRGW